MKLWLNHILCITGIMFTAQFCLAGGNQKKLYISDQKIPCAGDFECMQVKEKAKEAWHVYTDTIIGFDYQEGYAYTILVETVLPKNPYEGQLNDKYKLVKIVSKTKTGYNPAVKLEGKKWSLVSINDGKKTLNFNNEAGRMYMQLNVTGGKMTGHGICNSITGAASVQNNIIKITNISSTKMMCADQGTVFEKIFREFLAKPWLSSLESNTLRFTDSAGENMVFKTDPQVPEEGH